MSLNPDRESSYFESFVYYHYIKVEILIEVLELCILARHGNFDLLLKGSVYRAQPHGAHKPHSHDYDHGQTISLIRSRGRPVAPAHTDGAVFVSNHVSLLDAFWLDGVFGTNMKFISVAFVFDIPLFGWWLTKMGAVCIL